MPVRRTHVLRAFFERLFPQVPPEVPCLEALAAAEVEFAKAGWTGDVHTTIALAEGVWHVHRLPAQARSGAMVVEVDGATGRILTVREGGW